MSKKLWGAFVACAAVFSGQAGAVNTENYDIPYVGAMGSYVWDVVEIGRAHV